MAAANRTTTRYIGFRAQPDRDEDILGWWDALPGGERSHILRNLIRAYLWGEIVLTPEGEAPTEFSRDLQLAQLQAEVMWIRNTLMDLPDYLEQLIGGLKIVQAQSQPVAASSDLPITEQKAEQRARRISISGW